MKHVMIMAGGTGGHVFPGLAVAAELEKRQHKVSWMGTHSGIEARLVPAHGIPLRYIDIAGVRGKGLAGLLLAPWRIAHAFFQSLAILRQERPDCLLGMGGFVAGPGAIAGKCLGIPLVIHEQNAIAGTTNRLLARLANRVLQAFPGALSAAGKVLTVGNPVRENLPHKNDGDIGDRPLHLLVLGGSLGAKALNDVMPEVMRILVSSVDIRHQAGNKQIDNVAADYRAMPQVSVSAFIDDMADAYQWADLVLCRAGAMTVSEIAAVGLPAIFVPYPHAIDDHQTANANALVKAGAAIVIQQAQMTAADLAATIDRLNQDRVLLQEMAAKAAAAGIRDAASQVADNCLEVAR
ncbi:MAG TPA: undecaprenyldiphospho-muramoylpentapeptide beta-N-acetylglucosaminyltransferase [Pseudomonadales bacterium]